MASSARALTTGTSGPLSASRRRSASALIAAPRSDSATSSSRWRRSTCRVDSLRSPDVKTLRLARAWSSVGSVTGALTPAAHPMNTATIHELRIETTPSRLHILAPESHAPMVTHGQRVIQSDRPDRLCDKQPSVGSQATLPTLTVLKLFDDSPDCWSRNSSSRSAGWTRLPTWMPPSSRAASRSSPACFRPGGPRTFR